MTNAFDITSSPTTEPESLVIDAFTQWRKLLDYSDAEYSLFYEVHGGTLLTVNGTYDATNEWWAFVLGAGDYTNIGSGTVRWDLYVQRTSDGQRVLLSTGSFVVHLSTADRRTHAEIMVAKIETVLQGRADHDIESYSIKNRSLTRMSPKELLHWRDYYIAEVARTGGSVTDAAKTKKNTLRVRFI